MIQENNNISTKNIRVESAYPELFSNLIPVGILPFCRACQFFWGWPMRGFCQQDGTWVNGMFHNCPDWELRKADEWPEDGGVENDQNGDNVEIDSVKAEKDNGKAYKSLNHQLLSQVLMSTRAIVRNSRQKRRLRSQRS